MSNNQTPASWFENTKKSYGLLAEFATFIIGVIGSFLLPPPGWVSSSGDKVLVRLAQFVVIIIAGLIFLLVKKWSRKKHVVRWVAITLVSLVLALAAYFGYQHLLDTRTCEYDNHQVVIGTEYTEHGLNYLAKNPNSTCKSLLEDHTGAAEDVWTKKAIDRSRYILAGSYILNLPLFMLCLIAVIQALSCSDPAKGRSNANKPAA
jgi:hypothetical protein